MRILVVHPRMSVMGGGERVAMHSLLTAKRVGLEVGLMAEEFDTRDFERFYECEGLFETVERLSFPRFRPTLAPRLLVYRRIAYYQARFREVLSKDNDFDLVLSTQDIAHIPSGRAPLIQYCHFPEYFARLQSNPSSFAWKLYYEPAKVYFLLCARRVNTFLSNSEYTRSFVKSLWNRESQVLYPPCPVSTYANEFTTKEDLVITVGRIVPEKRTYLFLEIARSLPRTKFVVVGNVGAKDKGYFEKLQQTAPVNVSFLTLPLRKLKDFLARAKVYVHCMENEHFGVAIVEAMAAGCVPVVHDSGGPREIVTPEVGYRWGDVPSATAYVSRLIADNKLREKFAVAARSRANLFSVEVFESGLSEVLKRYMNHVS